MNGNYYQNPTFPSTGYQTPPGNMQITDVNKENYVYNEQSYIENILRLNKGRKVRAYVSYPDSSAWQNKVYEGIIEEAGKYASELLKEHEEELKKLVESLMQKGIMAKSEIDAIFSEESSLVNKADLVEN